MGIAANKTPLPVMAAAKSLQSLGVGAEPDFPSLLETVQEHLASIACGDPAVVKETLAEQVLVLGALAQFSARRLSVSDDPLATKVYGTLLLRAQEQSRRTLELLESLNAPDPLAAMFRL